jgi:hypothetical protein
VATPTPIRLHAEMHEAITAYGLPAYVEKPPTLDFAELDRMIAADTRARKASLVGFNFIVEKSRLALKERLLSGEFGAIRGGTLSALWPRPSGYFARNAWSGRLIIDGHIVLDSCFGNAMAHFVHNMLFWTGTPGLYSWAEIAAVRAELYRAHADRGGRHVLRRGRPGDRLHPALRALARLRRREHELGDRHLREGDPQVRGRRPDRGLVEGRPGERISSGPFDGLEENHLEYCRYMRGEVQRPATTLEDSRPLVVLNDLAHVSSGSILPIPAHLVSVSRDEKEQKDYLSVAGMAKTVENFLGRGIWPGYAGWRRDNGEVVTPADLPRFHGVVRSMAESR